MAKVVGDVQQRSGKKRKQNEADDDGTVLAKLDTVSRSLSDRKRKKRKSKKTTQKAVELVNKSLKDNDLHTNKEKRSKSNTSTSSKRTSPKRRSHQKVHHMGFSVSCQDRMCPLPNVYMLHLPSLCKPFALFNYRILSFL